MPLSLKRLARWAALAFGLHLLWEIGHLRFYTLWSDPDRLKVAGYVLHCTLGDVLIATAAYGITALLFRRSDWPIEYPYLGGSLLLLLGLAYTGFSEWFNVYQLESWRYTSEMPLLAGIGLTPLLQWLILPPLMLLLIRRLNISR